jgi:hypothetical protein
LVDIIETKEGLDWVMIRGVCKKPVTIGNEVKIGVSHTSNYYSTQMTPRIGDEYRQLVFGESVDRVPLIYESGEVEEPTIVGDGYIPAIEVSDEFDSVSVWTIGKYDLDTVSAEEWEESVFTIGDTYLCTGGSKDLILAPTGNDRITIINGKLRYWMQYFIIPMNLRNGDFTNVLEIGSTVVLQKINSSKYYPPYGTEISLDLLQYEDSEKFYKFPSYVDSLEIVDDHIDILDSDNSGDAFRAPTSAGYAPEYVPIEVFDPVNLEYRGSGIWAGQYYKNHGIIGDGNFADRNIDDSVDIIVSWNTIPQGSFANAVSIMQYSYRPEIGTIPSELFITLKESYDFSVSGGFPTNKFTIKVASVTDVYTIGSWNNNELSETWIYNIFPKIVRFDADNYFYRWESVANKIGKSLGALVDGMEEFERASGITVYIISTASIIDTGAPITNGSVTFSHKMFLAEPVSYDSTKLFYSGVSGKEDSVGSPITDTKSAYESTLQLQNYEINGITIPDEGWGLGYPVGSLDSVIGDTSNIPVIPMQYSTNSVDTKNVKQLLLGYTFGIGKIDNNGKEAWTSALSFWNGGGYEFNKSKIKKDSKPIFSDISDNRIYPEIGVKYSNGNIAVSNVEEEIFNADYVTGVTDINEAEAIWTAGRLLYQYYGIKNKYPEKLGNITGIKNEADAIQYIKNQYSLAGILFSEGVIALYRVYTCTFITPIEFWWDALVVSGVIDPNFGLGAELTLTYPHKATSDIGNIIQRSYNPISGEVSIQGKFVGEQLLISEDVIIIETGSQADNIVETGSQTNNYIEGP